MPLKDCIKCFLNNKEILKWFFEEHKFFMTYVLYYALGLIVLIIYPFFKTISLIYVWIIGLLFLLIINIIKFRNIKDSVFYMFSSIPRGIFFMIGFLRPMKNPDNFPKDVIVIM